MSYIIKDWADNTMFDGKSFQSFEDAEEFLSVFIDDNGWNYDETRGEYVVYLIEESQS